MKGHQTPERSGGASLGESQVLWLAWSRLRYEIGQVALGWVADDGPLSAPRALLPVSRSRARGARTLVWTRAFGEGASVNGMVLRAAVATEVQLLAAVPLCGGEASLVFEIAFGIWLGWRGRGLHSSQNHGHGI